MTRRRTADEWLALIAEQQARPAGRRRRCSVESAVLIHPGFPTASARSPGQVAVLPWWRGRLWPLSRRVAMWKLRWARFGCA